jgi:ferric-dicitrate binding protein FerR (iron transport regulator)
MPLVLALGFGAIALLLWGLHGRRAATVVTQVRAHVAPEIVEEDRELIGPRQATLGAHRLVLEADTRVQPLSAGPGQVRLVLERGSAHFEVAHLRPSESFQVRATPVEVEVVGTRFVVERQPGCTTVGVDEGVVQVRFAGAVVARLHPTERRRFCATRSGGLETSAPGDELVRSALALIAEGRALDRAADLLERYRRQEPQGELTPEALFHLARLRARLGDGAAAAHLLDELAARFPDDERLPSLRAALERWR